MLQSLTNSLIVGFELLHHKVLSGFEIPDSPRENVLGGFSRVGYQIVHLLYFRGQRFDLIFESPHSVIESGLFSLHSVQFLQLFSVIATHLLIEIVHLVVKFTNVNHYLFYVAEIELKTRELTIQHAVLQVLVIDFCKYLPDFASQFFLLERHRLDQIEGHHSEAVLEMEPIIK